MLSNTLRIKIPLKIVELEEENFHLLANAVFDDHSTGWWVVDTGASKSVFDKNQLERYLVAEGENDQVHTAGISDQPLQTTIAHLKPFSFGKLHIPNQRVALLDLSHINELYDKAANLKICGMLGGDFLVHYQAKIDYRKKVMELIAG